MAIKDLDYKKGKTEREELQIEKSMYVGCSRETNERAKTTRNRETEERKKEMNSRTPQPTRRANEYLRLTLVSIGDSEGLDVPDLLAVG